MMTQDRGYNTSNQLISSPDVLSSAYQLGQRYNISALARILGKGATILANKLNPDCDTHHLYLGEAVAITELTNDNSILQAWATSRGQLLVDMPTGATTDEELADLVMMVTEAVAAFFAEYREARRDGVIDHIERKRIGECARAAVRAMLTLDSEVGAQVRELKR